MSSLCSIFGLINYGQEGGVITHGWDRERFIWMACWLHLFYSFPGTRVIEVGLCWQLEEKGGEIIWSQPCSSCSIRISELCWIPSRSTAEVMKSHINPDEVMGQWPAQSSCFTLKRASSWLCHIHERSHRRLCCFLAPLQRNGRGSYSFHLLTFFLLQGKSQLAVIEYFGQTLPKEKQIMI